MKPCRVISRLVTALVALVCVTVTANAQVARINPPGQGLNSTIPMLAVPRTIAAAEAEGALFARGPEPDSARRRLIEQYPGDKRRVCVRPVPQANAMQAGDFAVGAGLHRFVAGRSTKIWWSPIHDPTINLDGLLIRAALLTADTAATDTVRFVSLGYGYPVGIRPPKAFFPTYLTLPSPGDWVIVATSGKDWACIVLHVAQDLPPWERDLFASASARSLVSHGM